MLPDLCRSIGMTAPFPVWEPQAVAYLWGGIAATAWAIATPFIIRELKR